MDYMTLRDSKSIIINYKFNYLETKGDFEITIDFYNKKINTIHSIKIRDVGKLVQKL